MKKLSLLLTLGLLFAVVSANAAAAKSYQVTGPVLAVSDTMIVVQKGDEKWDISADNATLGSVKVGDKVTVSYQMSAKKIEVKPAK